jgi:hypothetical protein
MTNDHQCHREFKTQELIGSVATKRTHWMSGKQPSRSDFATFGQSTQLGKGNVGVDAGTADMH